MVTGWRTTILETTTKHGLGLDTLVFGRQPFENFCPRLKKTENIMDYLKFHLLCSFICERLEIFGDQKKKNMDQTETALD